MINTTPNLKSIHSRAFISLENNIESSQLMNMFENDLRRIYWSEQIIVKTIEKMIMKTDSTELISALKNQLEESNVQVKRLEEIFNMIGKKPEVKKSYTLLVLIKKSSKEIDRRQSGSIRDAAIITAARKIKHFEISSYGILCSFSEILRLTEASAIFEETMHEEEKADKVLTNLVLEDHLEETKEQSKRIDKVFAMLGLDRDSKKCKAMEGLIDENNEIAAYGSLCELAEVMGKHRTAELLDETLEEEEKAG